MCSSVPPSDWPVLTGSPAGLQADAHSIGYQVINGTACGAVHFSNVTQDFFDYQYATYARSVLMFDWVVVPLAALDLPCCLSTCTWQSSLAAQR